MSYRTERLARTLIGILLLPLTALLQAGRGHLNGQLLRHRTHSTSLPLLPVLWVALVVVLTIIDLLYS